MAGEEAPQSPWGLGTQGVGWTPKEFECVIKECVGGDCGRVRAIIGVARLGDYGTFMLVRAGVAALLEGRGLPRYRIHKVMAISGHRLKHLMELNHILEFKLVSGFRPRTIFDAYWQFTSLVNLRLPFIIKSRFDPPNDVCGVFKDEGLCHMFIAGYLIAETKKSTKEPSLRFKELGTTFPASVITMLSIANHLAMRYGIMTKVYINERQRRVYFILDDLLKDVEWFLENAWGDSVALTKLTAEEFLAFLAGLLAGDGTVVWSRAGIEVALTGDLRKERTLYTVIQGELKRRLGVEAFLKEYYNDNSVRLVAQNDDALKLLRLLPPLIEPLKELRRQVLINKDRLGISPSSRLFDLLGDGKRNGEKGVHGLQSYQAVRFFTVLLRLGLIRLKEVQGRRYRILETPTNPRGRLH